MDQIVSIKDVAVGRIAEEQQQCNKNLDHSKLPIFHELLGMHGSSRTLTR